MKTIQQIDNELKRIGTTLEQARITLLDRQIWLFTLEAYWHDTGGDLIEKETTIPGPTNIYSIAIEKAFQSIIEAEEHIILLEQEQEALLMQRNDRAYDDSTIFYD